MNLQLLTLMFVCPISTIALATPSRPSSSTQLNVAAQAVPAWIDRPLRKSDGQMLDNTVGIVELHLGRAAIVAMVGLGAREVLTGSSFTDQLRQLLESITTAGAL